LCQTMHLSYVSREHLRCCCRASLLTRASENPVSNCQQARLIFKTPIPSHKSSIGPLNTCRIHHYHHPSCSGCGGSNACRCDAFASSGSLGNLPTEIRVSRHQQCLEIRGSLSFPESVLQHHHQYFLANHARPHSLAAHSDHNSVHLDRSTVG